MVLRRQRVLSTKVDSLSVGTSDPPVDAKGQPVKAVRIASRVANTIHAQLQYVLPALLLLVLILHLFGGEQAVASEEKSPVPSVEPVPSPPPAVVCQLEELPTLSRGMIYSCNSMMAPSLPPKATCDVVHLLLFREKTHPTCQLNESDYTGLQHWFLEHHWEPIGETADCIVESTPVDHTTVTRLDKTVVEFEGGYRTIDFLLLACLDQYCDLITPPGPFPRWQGETVIGPHYLLGDKNLRDAKCRCPENVSPQQQEWGGIQCYDPEASSQLMAWQFECYKAQFNETNPKGSVNKTLVCGDDGTWIDQQLV
jgi:hypothetical protein